jgi:hypothetical protein
VTWLRLTPSSLAHRCRRGGRSPSHWATLAGLAVQKAVSHAAVGCASAAAAGGSCKAGAMSAGFSSLAGPLLPGGDTKGFHGGNFVGRMIVGAIGSKLGGGKYENGALTAAMAYLFNDLKARVWNSSVYNGKVSVGHVQITDEWDRSITSQYPGSSTLRNPNVTKDTFATLEVQDRPPDAEYLLKRLMLRIN